MKILFLINIGRRKRLPPQSLLDEFHRLLTGAAVDYRIEQTSSIAEAEAHAAQGISQGYDTVWIGGGDGTVNVLLNATFGMGVTLGVLPMGTVNALARSLGIPRNPLAAARYLLGAQPTNLDVGVANGRHFLCFASAGFDASVVHDASLAIKSNLGRAAFLVSGVGAAMKMSRLAKFEIDFRDGTEPRTDCGHSLVLSNICNYAGLRLFHNVHPSSGNMEMALFRHNRLLPILGWSARAAFGKAGESPAVGHRLVSSFHLTSSQPLFIQLDGEPIHLGDDRSIDFQCLPGAARILLKHA